MDDSDDSDVILIDSDDNNDCRSQDGGSTINVDTTVINNINNSTSNCYSKKQHQTKANHTIDIDTNDIECIDLDNSDSDDNKSCSSSSSSSSSGIPSPLFKTKSSSSVVIKPLSIIHTKSVSNSINITVAKKKGLSNDKHEIYKEEDDEDMLEAGEDYDAIIDIPFKMIEVEEI